MGLNIKSFFMGHEDEVEQVGIVALSFTYNKILVVHLDKDDNGEPKILLMASKTASGMVQREQALKQIVEENDLLGQKSCVVLGQNEYKLTMIDTPPDLDEEDIQGSISEYVEDYLDYKIDNTSTDIFHIPFKRANDGKNVSFLASVELSLVKRYESTILKSGLILEAIGIPELSYRKLIALERNLPSEEKQVQSEVSEGVINNPPVQDMNTYVTNPEQEDVPVNPNDIDFENIGPDSAGGNYGEGVSSLEDFSSQPIEPNVNAQMQAPKQVVNNNNITESVPAYQSDSGYALINLFQSGGNAYIYYKDSLLMSRNMSSKVGIDLSSFLLSSDTIISEQEYDETLMNLATYIQRTIDYCNGVFREAQINKLIYLPSDKVNIEAIKSFVDQQLGLPSHVFNLEEFINIPQKYQNLNLIDFYLVIGVALENLEGNTNAKD